MSITIEELQQQIKDQAAASSRREREQELAHQKKLQDLLYDNWCYLRQMIHKLCLFLHPILMEE
jgi:hypothetical protein